MTESNVPPSDPVAQPAPAAVNPPPPPTGGPAAPPVAYAGPATAQPGPYAGPEPTSDAKTMALVAHLLNVFFLVPLLVWLLKKDSHPFVDHQGKEATNFSLMCVIIHVICAVTQQPIPLGELKYWSAERQEAYASVEAVMKAEGRD